MNTFQIKTTISLFYSIKSSKKKNHYQSNKTFFFIAPLMTQSKRLFLHLWVPLCLVDVVVAGNCLPGGLLHHSVGYGQRLGALWQMNIWWALMAPSPTCRSTAASRHTAVGCGGAMWSASNLALPRWIWLRRLAVPGNSCLWFHYPGFGGEGRGAVAIKQTPAGNAGVLNPPNSSPRFPQPSLSPILAVSLALRPVHELVITKVSGSPAVYNGVTLHSYIWIDVSIFVSAGYKTKCPQPFCWED